MGIAEQYTIAFTAGPALCANADTIANLELLNVSPDTGDGAGNFVADHTLREKNDGHLAIYVIGCHIHDSRQFSILTG